MDALEDFLVTHDAGNLLDIACGTGNFTCRLASGLRSCASITGLDIKPDLEAKFLENVGGHDISFVASPIADFLGSGNTFDTISVSNALHHLEGVGKILGDLRGILTPGGTVIINEMYADGLTPAQQTQRDVHRFIADMHRVTGEYHRGAFTRSEIDALLTGAGLTARHAFITPNDEPPDRPEAGAEEALPVRVRETMDNAYPNGAPPDAAAEYERLKARAAETGIGSPPQLTLVCSFA